MTTHTCMVAVNSWTIRWTEGGKCRVLCSLSYLTWLPAQEGDARFWIASLSASFHHFPVICWMGERTDITQRKKGANKHKDRLTPIIICITCLTYMYLLCLCMYNLCTASIKVWISPLINTKITIGVSTNSVWGFVQLRHGLFHIYFVGVEMAQMVKAQVWYARRLGSEFDPPWIKTRYFSFK